MRQFSHVIITRGLFIVDIDAYCNNSDSSTASGDMLTRLFLKNTFFLMYDSTFARCSTTTYAHLRLTTNEDQATSRYIARRGTPNSTYNNTVHPVIEVSAELLCPRP